MKHCLAAVFKGLVGKISVRELPVPEPDAGEILVRVLGCTICGSDLRSFEGRRTVPVPTVLGHEIVGEIVRFGDTATHLDLNGEKLRQGDRVVWAIVVHCGACGMCERGLTQKCLRSTKYGHESFRPGRELLGGLAEYCLLVSGTSIVLVPDTLPLKVACPASCATATVAAAFEAAGNIEARSVCLLGAGMLGLTACAMARTFGASKVVAVDPQSARRDLALEFGATHSASPDEFPSLADITVGDLGFDVIVEVSGHTKGFQSAWPRIRTGGTLILVGSVSPEPPVPISLEQIVRRHLTIKGIHNYAPRHLAAAIDFLTTNHDRYPFGNLVSEWIPLTSIEDAFHGARRSDVIRIGIKP